MDIGAAARVSRAHGLITTRAAREAGIEAREIRRLVGQGSWIRLRRGIYVEAERWAELDTYVGQPRLLARATHLTLDAEHAFSHSSAALELAIPLLAGATDEVHISRNDLRRTSAHAGVREHAAGYHPSAVLERSGVPVLPHARTAVDMARTFGYPAGLVACDAVLRKGVTRAQLALELRDMTRWPGARAAAAAVRDADAGAETAAESLGRILVRELGLGEPRTQFPLLLPDGRTVWLDMLVGCHAFEVDGRIKYQAASNGDVAAERVVWEEKKRERLVVNRRIGVSRIIWADYPEPARSAARRRLLEEYAATEHRFGATLSPDIEAYAERLEPLRQQRLLTGQPFAPTLRMQ
ncbi:type IV toxin-antitoxin system AbiEi family antitoxin domain-containing protein [Nocardioides jejuensis]|uniref:AbiEi antitoxin N-terminal domain-containing protein n=1 Tax=Nocardioides jejuensis TaxID=2502782 RepID=A0A4R1BVC6_9ACTN|nr:type IV toxin-antitoxin system AbiEi family antitoxin domain-containing protein [Nocardioides jejuensis]TCJ21924.1 hypothetical protein EPD65_14160 [Nocardioides jejuensis]